MYSIPTKDSSVEETAAEIVMRLVVGDGSLLFRLAIGRRLILALSHCGNLATISGLRGKGSVVAQEQSRET